MSLIKTNAIIEQHLHGAYGVDFLNCSLEELAFCAKKFFEDGVVMFLPTLATAPIEVLQRQIKIIKSAMGLLEKEYKTAKILGVNLEACFISPAKKGIHDETQLLDLSVCNFKKLEDEVIRLVTIAPEMDSAGVFVNYLHSKKIKVFAGHTMAHDLSSVDGVTHLFNAMSGINHREKNTVTSALLNDNLYCELIADGFHVDYDNVKLVLKVKPLDKVILISDALPIAKSNKNEMEFCSKKIYLRDGKATDVNGVIAGSSMLLTDIIRKLVQNNILELQLLCELASNTSRLFGLKNNNYILWDEDLNIVEVGG